VQVDPDKSNLKPPGTKRLKLIYDQSLSTSAFNFNVHRYNMAVIIACVVFLVAFVMLDFAPVYFQKLIKYRAGAYTRPLLTST
jgi:hypothetical protein